MKKFEKKIRINAPAARVYDYATRPENLPVIWPSLVEVRNVKRQGDGSHSFDWTYKMVGIPLHGRASTIRVTPDKFIEVDNQGQIKSTFRWTYDEVDDSTELTLAVEYEIPIPLIGKLAESFVARSNEREAESLLMNLKERVESMEEAGAEVQPSA